ncbi:MAG: hypothetical protein ACREQ9_16580 [Candidatus Binatia bacterium]
MKRPYRAMMAAAVVVLTSAMGALAGDGAASVENGGDDSTIESFVFSDPDSGDEGLVDPLEGYVGLSIDDERGPLGGGAQGRLHRGEDAVTGGLFSGK